MKKVKINLNAKTIIDAGEIDAVVSDAGEVFIMLASGIGGFVGSSTDETSAETKKEVPDAPEPTAKKAAKKPAAKKSGKKAAKKESFIAIDDINSVEEGDEYYICLPAVFLDDGDDPDAKYKVSVDSVTDEGINFKLLEEYDNFDVEEFELTFDMFSDDEGGKLYVKE